MCSATRDVEYEGDENIMQFTHIILSRRSMWQLSIEQKKNMHLGVGIYPRVEAGEHRS